MAKELAALDAEIQNVTDPSRPLKRIDEIEMVLICIVRTPVDPATLPPMRRIKVHFKFRFLFQTLH